MQPACDLGETLLCCENILYDAESDVHMSERVCKAVYDPVMSSDRRVLANLLACERRYVPSYSYFKAVQNEIQAPMRRILAYWMVEVCEENRCQDDVLPLAMNLLDRFLSVANVRKQQLQLLGAVCLFISSKLRETRSLPAELLVQCTDNSITLQDMVEWELLVLQKLRWEVSAITAHDFLTPLLQRLPLHHFLPVSRVPEVRRQAQTFVVMCATELQFMQYPCSVVAAASLTAALYGLVTSQRDSHLIHLLTLMSRVVHTDLSVLRDCWSQIERMVRDLAADDGPAQSDMETSAASGSDVTTIPASNNSSANNKAMMTPQWREVAG